MIFHPFRSPCFTHKQETYASWLEIKGKTERVKQIPCKRGCVSHYRGWCRTSPGTAGVSSAPGRGRCCSCKVQCCKRKRTNGMKSESLSGETCRGVRGTVTHLGRPMASSKCGMVQLSSMMWPEMSRDTRLTRRCTRDVKIFRVILNFEARRLSREISRCLETWKSSTVNSSGWSDDRRRQRANGTESVLKPFQPGSLRRDEEVQSLRIDCIAALKDFHDVDIGKVTQRRRLSAGKSSFCPS